MRGILKIISFSFWDGVASVLDIYPVRRNSIRDINAISDWDLIGDDMNAVFEDMEAVLNLRYEE